MTATVNSLGDYAQRILTARVYDVATETPLDPMPRLSACRSVWREMYC